MTPERWTRIEEIYHRALDQEESARSAFVQQACLGDEELRQEVESLLAQSDGSFLDRAVAQIAADASGFFHEDPTLSHSLAGRELGSYHVLAKIGEGGMGVVYRARDSKLGRDVAIKVLPSNVVNDPERLVRFRREAKLLASLNHPNIASIYALEEASGTHFLVMELVEGKTLAQRVTRGALPVKQVLVIGRQVAEALDHAHKHKIIHRDLKPANVILTGEGCVKVLDFGLAKALADDTVDSAEGPTLSAMPTEAGQIMGTPAYMSPEQAEGKRVDEQTDIWAFGCLLYELLTGQRAFQGDTAASTIASILREEPKAISQLVKGVPNDVERIVRRCLQKEPEHRFHSMADLKFTFEELKQESDFEKLIKAKAPNRRRRWWLWAVAAAVLLVASYMIFGRGRQWFGARPAPLRAEFSQLTSQPGIEWFPSLSPNGKWFVYSGTASNGQHIYLQAVGGQNRLDLTPGSMEDNDQPAFSPDGEKIAFRSSRGGGGIFVMGRTGEDVRRLTNTGFNPSWSSDGTHLAFNTEPIQLFPQNAEHNSELWTVAVNTGETRRLTTRKDAVLASWSPHNLRIAFTSRAGPPIQGDIYTIPAAGGPPTRVTSSPARDWNSAWSPDGKYLYFASDRGGSMNLWRVRIDETSGKTLGEPEPITTPAPYFAHPSLSADGKHIVYTSVDTTVNIQQLTLDGSGATKEKTAWLTTGSKRWTSPDPSPDGQWVAFYSLTQPEGHLYIVHPDGTGLREVTNDATDRMPQWSPDGKWITFFSDRSGDFEIWAIRPDASGLHQLTEGGMTYHAWSPDGSRIAAYQVLTSAHPDGGQLFIFDPHRPWEDQTLEKLPIFDPSSGIFQISSWSPDGRRLVGQVVGEHPGIAMYSLSSRTYTRLTGFGEWPVWLPDSQRVLFVANGNSFYIVDASSRKVRKIFSVANDVIGPPRLTSDGKTAYYSRRVTEADIWLCTLR